MIEIFLIVKIIQITEFFFFKNKIEFMNGSGTK